MKFGTIYVDPPWPYREVKSSDKSPKFETLTGYSSQEYSPLSIEDLQTLPVRDVSKDKSVLVLWATFPMLRDALSLFDAWGFEYKTALPWVKCVEMTPGAEPAFKPIYGVGYWMRGAAEPLLIGSRGGSYRSNYIGLLSKNAKHSRKPDTVYELMESLYPEPRLELFARRPRDGWTQLGNELPGDREDIRISLPRLAGIPITHIVKKPLL